MGINVYFAIWNKNFKNIDMIWIIYLSPIAKNKYCWYICRTL